jgi:hypothetical protein
MDLDRLGAGEEAAMFNGEDMTGWKVLKEIFFDAAGRVEAGGGTMILGAGNDLTGVKWQGAVLRDEFEISLEGRRLEGADFFCGLTFPVRKGHLTLILGGWGGTVVGLSNIDYMSAVENSTTQNVEFKKGRWYAIRVRVAGGRIRIFLDKEKIIDHAIEGHRFEIWPQQEDARPLGITTYSTKGEFRNFRYRRLK